MPDVINIAELILNADFEHSDGPIEEITNEDVVDEIVKEDSSDDELSHYGVLGMKWGVRKDKKYKRLEGETDGQYERRMERESLERRMQNEADARLKAQKQKEKADKAAQKRTLKSQERMKQMELKSKAQERKDQLKTIEKQKKEQNKMIEKEAKEKAKEEAKKNQKEKKKTKNNLEKSKESASRGMTDQELRDAISRMQLEAQYRQLTAKPQNALIKGAKRVLGQSIINIATEATTAVGRKAVNEAFEKAKIDVQLGGQKKKDKDKDKDDE